jgi:hypothetical protein
MRNSRGEILNWYRRRGVIIWIARNRHTIAVQWAGRASADPLPPAALELIK